MSAQPLIPVHLGAIGQAQVQTVSARDLHNFLEVGTAFKDWIVRRIGEYGFSEGQDFCSFLSESSGGRPSREYAISIDMAKELAMVERNEKGKQARQYFIECERRAKAVSANSPALPDFTDPAKAARAWADEFEKRKSLEAQAVANLPKVRFAESIEVSKSTILVGEMAKLIKQSTGYDIGQNRFFEWLRANGYLHSTGVQTNLPTQRSIDAGWMVIKVGSRAVDGGDPLVTRTTRITGKGQLYFINKFRGLACAHASDHQARQVATA